jgi:HlyD family secretion protein
MNKRMVWSLVLALVVILFGMSVLPAGAASTAPTEAASAYSEVTLKKGSITQNVIATGSLRFKEEITLKLPEALTLESIEVEAGDAVVKGQVLARYDTDALKDSLQAAKDTLTAQDAAVLTLLGAQISDQSIKTEIAGIIKGLNLKEGQMVQQTLADQPAAVISTNGLMQVSFTPSGTLSLGQTVKVRVGTLTQSGSVARLNKDGSALITFPDTRARIDQDVTVTGNNAVLGEGKAQISLPYLLFTEVDGVVSDVYMKVNSEVKSGATIYTVENAALSEDYLKALADREEMVQTVLRLEELLANPVFTCETEGIVSLVAAGEGTALQKGARLLSLYSGSAFALDVAVDELDILSVKAGQEGFAALDAITNAMLSVKVEKISLLGTSASGITSYTVTMSVREDSRLRSGMNGTATLTVGEARDSVLVPLAALMGDRGGNYVLLKGEGETGSAGAEGIKTYVEVGLSDAIYAAVSTGLKEGDVVLVRTSALIGTGENRQTQPGLNMMNPDRPFNPGDRD